MHVAITPISTEAKNNCLGYSEDVRMSSGWGISHLLRALISALYQNKKKRKTGSGHH